MASISEHILPPRRSSFRSAPWALWRYVILAPRLVGIDVVHAVVEYPYALVADAAARRAHVPSVVSAQGTYGVVPLMHQPDRWLYSRALRRASVVTVPSRYTQGAMAKALAKPLRIDVLPNAVDGLRFSAASDRGDVRTRLGLSTNGPLVLSVGHMKPRKGFDVLVRAFAIVHAALPDANLALVGGGDASRLEQQVAELGLGDVVHVLGRTSEADLVGALPCV